MFGYIRPQKAELKVWEFEAYQAAYCGLCRCLGKRYGFSARFLVSYDLAFLYLLLTGSQASFSAACCRCPARCGAKKHCMDADAAMEFCADATIILGYWKMRDAAADAGGVKRIGAKLAACFFGRRYRKAAHRQPPIAQTAEQAMAQLAALEQAASASLDATADCFARMTAACAGWYADDRERRCAEQLLYHVGRYIYLTDALEDLPEDCRKDRYNPLRYRFCPEAGKLPQGSETQLIQTIDRSIDLAAAALELLEQRRSAGILHNIIYLGLPSVLKAVRTGSFQNKQHRRTL